MINIAKKTTLLFVLVLFFQGIAAFLPPKATAEQIDIYDAFKLWYAYEKNHIKDLKAIEPEVEKMIWPALEREKAGTSDSLEFDIFSAQGNRARFRLTGPSFGTPKHPSYSNCGYYFILEDQKDGSYLLLNIIEKSYERNGCEAGVYIYTISNNNIEKQDTAKYIELPSTKDLAPGIYAKCNPQINYDLLYSSHEADVRLLAFTNKDNLHINGCFDDNKQWIDGEFYTIIYTWNGKKFKKGPLELESIPNITPVPDHL